MQPRQFSPAAQDSGEITGSVISSATRTGIFGVAVRVLAQLGSRYETSTDARGEFSIRGLKPGEYLVFVRLRRPLAGVVYTRPKAIVRRETPAAQVLPIAARAPDH